MKKYERLDTPPETGKTYPNAGSDYRITSPIENGCATVVRVKDGWTCTAHNMALYRINGDAIELQWDYSTGGHFAD